MTPRMKATKAFFVLTLFLLGGGLSASAATITLSTHSSNGFSPYTEPEYLDATLVFTIITDNELRLTVTNNTDGNPADYQFAITEVYFNYNDTVSSLSWNGPATNGWVMEDNENNFHIDNFGYFDVQLYVTNPPKDIDPGDSETFDFVFGGTGSAEDFTTYLSLDRFNEGDTCGLAVAEFVGGGSSGNAWAYGMTVPEPATVLMLGFGSLFLLRRKHGKRNKVRA